MKPSYVPKSLLYVYDFSAEMLLKQMFRQIRTHERIVPHVFHSNNSGYSLQSTSLSADLPESYGVKLTQSLKQLPKQSTQS